jgi:hypothetical protein
VAYLDFSKARPLFESLRRANEPGSHAWLEATVGLACCLHHGQPDVKSDKRRAATLYEEVTARGGEHPCVRFALMQRARLADKVDFHGDAPQPALAEELYRRLMRATPRDRWAHEAALFLGQLLIFSPDPAAARRGVAELHGWLQMFPDNPMAALQWSLIGHAYSGPLRKPLAAVEALRTAEAAGLPEMTPLDSFYWRIAALAEKGGDTRTAIEYFRRIILEEPRSGYGYEAQLRIRALGRAPPALTDPFAERDS